jgi:hypothetical protein
MMQEDTVLRVAPLLGDQYYVQEIADLLDYHADISLPIWKAERDIDFLTVILKHGAYRVTGRIWRSLDEFVFFLEDRELIGRDPEPMDSDIESIVLGSYVHWYATSNYPDMDHAKWIAENYHRIAPYSSQIRDRKDASREAIEVFLEGESPALSSGSL